ncbi:uncharacterized protein FFE2_06669 [Fusarium fujikuroi]|nr:uncharacterized protein FFE2_06669 [Fusarium fujikuroi]
MDYGGNFDHFF